MGVGETFGTIQSSRILYSDRFLHDLRLTEQEIGVIAHGLHVLGAAFSMETDYLRLIEKITVHLKQVLEKPAIEL